MKNPNKFGIFSGVTAGDFHILLMQVAQCPIALTRWYELSIFTPIFSVLEIPDKLTGIERVTLAIGHLIHTTLQSAMAGHAAKLSVYCSMKEIINSI